MIDWIIQQQALQAMAKWRYKPSVQGGQAQRQTGILVQLDFQLSADATPSHTSDSEMEKASLSGQ